MNWLNCQKSSFSSPRSTRGFTLVEVLVVIAIIGILSGMAVVGMGGKVDYERTRGAAHSITAFLARMSAEVKKTNVDMSVQFHADRIDAYRSIDCSGAVAFSEILETTVEIPSLGTPTDLISGAAGWNHGGCLAFEKAKFGENPVASSGWVRVDHKGRASYKGITVKPPTDNRFRTMISIDGGATWTAQ